MRMTGRQMQRQIPVGVSARQIRFTLHQRRHGVQASILRRVMHWKSAGVARDAQRRPAIEQERQHSTVIAFGGYVARTASFGVGGVEIGAGVGEDLQASEFSVISG